MIALVCVRHEPYIGFKSVMIGWRESRKKKLAMYSSKHILGYRIKTLDGNGNFKICIKIIAYMNKCFIRYEDMLITHLPNKSLNKHSGDFGSAEAVIG